MDLKPHELPHDAATWPSIPTRAVNRWILAADLGQSIDPTAICVLNHRVVPVDKWTPYPKRKQWKQDRVESFHVRHLERLPLGMAYPAQIQHVAMLLTLPPLDAGATLVIDETGVGRAVGDMFDAAGLAPQRVTITFGHEATRHGSRTWHVPKGLLISALEARMHSGEFGIAELIKDAGALVEELKDFRRKVSDAGRATFAARSGAHDDLVLACAIAVWQATNVPFSSSGPLFG
jgi:hypothetical protein